METLTINGVEKILLKEETAKINEIKSTASRNVHRLNTLHKLRPIPDKEALDELLEDPDNYLWSELLKLNPEIKKLSKTINVTEDMVKWPDELLELKGAINDFRSFFSQSASRNDLVDRFPQLQARERDYFKYCVFSTTKNEWVTDKETIDAEIETLRVYINEGPEMERYKLAMRLCNFLNANPLPPSYKPLYENHMMRVEKDKYVPSYNFIKSFGIFE